MIRKMTALSLAGLVAFVACKKNDNPTPKPQPTPADSTVVVISDSAAIIGKWNPIRQVSSYYSPSTGALLDNEKNDVNPQDYLDFENGKLYTYYNDGGDISYDTTVYTIRNHYFFFSENNRVDSAHFTITKDTLLLTQISLNTEYNNGVIANEYDTSVLIKIK